MRRAAVLYKMAVAITLISSCSSTGENDDVGGGQDVDGVDTSDGSDASDGSDVGDGSDASDGSEGVDTTDASDGSDGTDGVPSCTAEAPVCEPGCGAGASCVYEAGACSCKAVVPTCTELNPTCEPGCSGSETCVYTGGVCACESTCDAGAPACDPPCGAGDVCDATCNCVAEACAPDAPVCEPGCTDGQVCNAECACEAAPPDPIPNVLLRPSRSSSVDISPDDQIVAMVNSDGDSVSFFDVGTSDAEVRTATVASSLGGAYEPMSVVIHPNGKTAFVANRGGSVSAISGIDTAAPSVAFELELDGEPIGAALSPTGATLYVTDWVGGRLYVIDTDGLTLTATHAVGTNPFAIAVTNDGDVDDDDEQVLVTEFYGRPEGKEAQDLGRQGIVYAVPAAGAFSVTEIPLAPLASCFTGDLAGSVQTTGCFPNQLMGITVHTAFGKTRAYVVSVGAAPQGPVAFNHNMQANISVIDVPTLKEIPELAKNLNQLVKDQQPDSDGDDSKGRRFLNMPMGIAFVGNPDIAVGYVPASGSDILLRVAYGEDDSVTVGSATNFNIPVGQSPQGLATKNAKLNARAYVGNLISRDLSVVSFADQATVTTVESTPTPEEEVPVDADAVDVWKGKRFFNTSTGIWAKEGWGSCQGCHFLGLSDSVTWSFAAGPRQTISLDGQYATGNPSDMRALNWTAIFDETHDFEGNTRGTSGGKGAIQRADGTPVASPAGAPAPFAQITVEDATTVENHQALNGSMKHLVNTPAICGNPKTCPDWNQIDDYIRTVRSPRAVTSADAEAGRALFLDGGCQKCHSGPKWTTSSTFYQPQIFTGALPSRVFEAQRAFTTAKDPNLLKALPANTNKDATLVAGDDSTGTPALRRQACNLRDVGTFGAVGGSDEKRANGTEAQGKNGYNPPSLLGLALGAPYFHNGAALTLADVFDATRFSQHLTAGNPNFTLSTTERDQLIAFLLSIDENTTPIPIPADSKLCPENFTQLP